MFGRLHQLNRIFRLALNCNFPVESSAGSLQSWGISALVHGSILGLLALVTLALPRQSDFDSILTELPEPERVVQFEPPVQSLENAAGHGGSSAGGREGPAGPIAAGLETAQERESRKVDHSLSAARSVLPLDFDPPLPPQRDLTWSALGTKLGRGYATGGGFGSGIGDGQGNGSGSQFFELSTIGAKFVYVLDGSGSMTEPHSEARTKLDRVKIELVRSIGGLPAGMEFYVIFFNRHAVPMKARELQPATLDNKQKYLEWVVKVQGGGGTDPSEALKLALELKPDVIYLLTDGVFDGKVTGEVTKLNTRGVAIHTFCFGNASGESLLQDMARRNHGTYKFIP
jgi:von Willebrand factor type A domain